MKSEIPAIFAAVLAHGNLYEPELFSATGRFYSVLSGDKPLTDLEIKGNLELVNLPFIMDRKLHRISNNLGIWSLEKASDFAKGQEMVIEVPPIIVQQAKAFMGKIQVPCNLSQRMFNVLLELKESTVEKAILIRKFRKECSNVGIELPLDIDIDALIFSRPLVKYAGEFYHIVCADGISLQKGSNGWDEEHAFAIEATSIERRLVVLLFSLLLKQKNIRKKLIKKTFNDAIALLGWAVDSNLTFAQVIGELRVVLYEKIYYSVQHVKDKIALVVLNDPPSDLVKSALVVGQGEIYGKKQDPSKATTKQHMNDPPSDAVKSTLVVQQDKISGKKQDSSEPKSSPTTKSSEQHIALAVKKVRNLSDEQETIVTIIVSALYHLNIALMANDIGRILDLAKKNILGKGELPSRPLKKITGNLFVQIKKKHFVLVKSEANTTSRGYIYNLKKVDQIGNNAIFKIDLELFRRCGELLANSGLSLKLDNVNSPSTQSHPLAITSTPALFVFNFLYSDIDEKCEINYILNEYNAFAAASGEKAVLDRKILKSLKDTYFEYKNQLFCIDYSSNRIWMKKIDQAMSGKKLVVTDDNLKIFDKSSQRLPNGFTAEDVLNITTAVVAAVYHQPSKSLITQDIGDFFTQFRSNILNTTKKFPSRPLRCIKENTFVKISEVGYKLTKTLQDKQTPILKLVECSERSDYVKLDTLKFTEFLEFLQLTSIDSYLKPPSEPSPESLTKLSKLLHRIYKVSIEPELLTDSHEKICRSVQKIFHSEGHTDVSVYLFGSAINGLGTKSSDVDMTIISNPINSNHPLCKINRLTRTLRSFQMQKVVPIKGAKVPIVKFTFPRSKVECDLNFGHSVGIYNSLLIRQYLLLDSRVRPLILLIKYWAKTRNINNPSNDNTISSYAYCLMAIAFLQHKGVLPNLQADNWKTTISVDLNYIKTQDRKPSIAKMKFKYCTGLNEIHDAKVLDPIFGNTDDSKFPSSNLIWENSSIAQLFADFLRYYGYQHEYLPTKFISVRDGGFVDRPPLNTKSLMVVFDPFDDERNCTHMVKGNSLRKVLKEFRAACNRISLGNIENLFNSK